MSVTKDAGPSLLLAVRDLWLRLGGRPVLIGIDLQLHEGEIHAVIGSNGADKSTLAYAAIRSLGTEGRAVLLITHEERVAAMADSATQHCGGRIVCQGEVDRSPRSPSTLSHRLLPGAG